MKLERSSFVGVYYLTEDDGEIVADINPGPDNTVIATNNEGETRRWINIQALLDALEDEGVEIAAAYPVDTTPREGAG